MKAFFIITYGIAAGTGIFCWSRLTWYARMFAILLVIGCCTEFIGIVLQQKHHYNLHIYAIYALIEFSLVMIAGTGIVRSTLKKQLTIAFIALYLLLCSYFVFLRNENILIFKLYPLGCAVISCMYISHLLQMLQEERNERETLLLCYSTLIYFTGIIPFFGLEEFLGRIKIFIQLSSINYLLNICRFVLLGAAFIVFYQKRGQPAHDQ